MGWAGYRPAAGNYGAATGGDGGYLPASHGAMLGEGAAQLQAFMVSGPARAQLSAASMQPPAALPPLPPAAAVTAADGHGGPVAGAFSGLGDAMQQLAAAVGGGAPATAPAGVARNLPGMKVEADVPSALSATATFMQVSWQSCNGKLGHCCKSWW